MAALDDDNAPSHTPAPAVFSGRAAPATLPPFPDTFPAFIAALKARKELLTAAALETQCACAAWSPQRCALRVDPAGADTVKQRLRGMLSLYEGGAATELDITVAEPGTVLSEGEKRRLAYAEAEKALLASDDMRRVKQRFPEARILDITLSAP